MRMTILLILGGLISWLTAPVAIAAPMTLNIKSSGWVTPSSDLDLNGDMDTGGLSTSEGKSNLGPVSGGGVSDLLPWDGVTFCDFDPDTGSPIAVEVVYIGQASVTRFKKGDLLYFVMNPSPPSTLCFNFIDSTFTFTIYQDVTGGTGRFQGATGSAVSTGFGENVLPPTNVLNTFETTSEVQINLP